MNRREMIAASMAAAACFTLAPAARAQSAAGPAVREMLTSAARLSTTRLGARDGFFGDSLVRIPLPGTLRSAQQRLRPAGLSGPLDDVELRMNRAAEAAMPAARDLFVNAIRTLTIEDAAGIVRGGDTAATQYLRGRTAAPLTGLMRPPMERTLSESGAYSAVDAASNLVTARSGLGRLFGSRAPAANLRDQVTDFAVEKALDGVFHYIGVEERAIRRDPLRQGASLLGRIMGG
ncbi:DUF4197 domain-containing protein [Alkalicaulis satelles]|uniref:DUF4197 domain-containing protein n=1 Tax=Alkalicaulis satelles TaxID=2609175 RepID=A0A5M6ZI40_9PROT|nr:DUF4197 domain-containing protein [Alkalicaulis satelles]KAA5803474.1 DUF4197 domain-containing protein [Alkalicaulis satelles]